MRLTSSDLWYKTSSRLTCIGLAFWARRQLAWIQHCSSAVGLSFVCAAEGEKRQEYQKDCVRLSSLFSAGAFSEWKSFWCSRWIKLVYLVKKKSWIDFYRCIHWFYTLLKPHMQSFKKDITILPERRTETKVVVFFPIPHIMGEDHSQTELYSVVSYCIVQSDKIKLFFLLNVL